MLSMQQRLVVAAASALLSHLLTLEFAWRDDSLGEGLRRLGALPLDATDSVRSRLRDAEKQRKEARRKQWIRDNPRPARIIMPQ